MPRSMYDRAPQLRYDMDRTTLIISAWPRPAFSKHNTTGYHVMEPCPPCEIHKKGPCAACKPVGRYVVHATIESSDIGDDRRIYHKTSDRELAFDLLDGCEQYGLVVCEGMEPSAAEIEQAYAKMEKYLRLTVENEDRVRSGPGGRAFNPEHAGIGLTYFNQTRTWMEDTTTRQPCSLCGTPNLLNIARCSNQTCGAIINWEKARDHGVLRPDEVRLGLAKGYLKHIPGIDGPSEPAVVGKK